MALAVQKRAIFLNYRKDNELSESGERLALSNRQEIEAARHRVGYRVVLGQDMDAEEFWVLWKDGLGLCGDLKFD